MPSKTVLVTGANGFVGRPLCRVLQEAGFQVCGAVRRADSAETLSDMIDCRALGELGPETDWTQVLNGVDAVVHLAARVHVMCETANDPLAAFLRINALGTERLARQAALTGVRRFVYVSSIGVNGNRTTGSPFSESDAPSPHDPYAISKWEAEQALRRIAEDTGLETVVVRPPLVYGPGVKGNLRPGCGRVRWASCAWWRGLRDRRVRSNSAVLDPASADGRRTGACGGMVAVGSCGWTVVGRALRKSFTWLRGGASEIRRPCCPKPCHQAI